MRYLIFLIPVFLFAACNNSNSNTTEDTTDQVETLDSLENSEQNIEEVKSETSSEADVKLGKKYQTLVDNNILSVEEASAYAQIERNYMKRRKAYQEQGKWDGKTKEAKQTRSMWTKAKNGDLEKAIGSDKYQMVQNYFKSNK